MGSMMERPAGSRRWRLRVHVGERQYVSETFVGSERDARKALARLEVAAQERRAPRPSRDTVAALLDDWWSQKAWRSVGGRRQARDDLDRYLIPELGEVRAARLEDRHIAELYRRLTTAGPECAAKRGRPLGPATVRRLHVTLRSALAWGVRKGRLGRNPAVYVDVPASPKTRVRGPDPADLVRLLELADATMEDFAVFVRVAAATGRRREDVLGLTMADLRPDEGALVFERRVVLAGRGAGVVVEDLDKNGRAARVDVDPVTMARIGELVTDRQRRARAFGAVWGKRSYLFSDLPGGSEPWRPDSTSRKFRLLREAAGLPDVTLHGLRHGHITELLERGLNIEAVAMRVGDNPNTILGTYAHARRTADRRAAAIMDEVLNGTGRRLVAVEGGGRAET
jgi:integrase